MASLRILIADDHELIRRGVRNLIAQRRDWVIVGEARDGIEAVEKTCTLKPDVVILDFSMPKLDGPGAATKISALVPEVAIIVLTMHESEQIVREALRSGAKGFVSKTDADKDLIEAVEAVGQKRRFFTRRVGDLVLEGFLMSGSTSTHGKDDKIKLTTREREVMSLLAEGVTSKQIATRLRISVRTVESHRIHINRKLGFGSIAELVRYAIRQGIVATN